MLRKTTPFRNPSAPSVRWPLSRVALILSISCGEPAAPTASIAFKADASTCSGAAPVELYIDGSKVGTPTLTAGVASEAFTVATGSHVVSATSVSSGAVWGAEQINVTGPIIYVLTCSTAKPLMAFQGTIMNGLALPVSIVAGTTDTIAAGASKTYTYVGSGSFVWAPLPRRYSDGTTIPDDGLVGLGLLGNNATTTLGPTSLGDTYFTFSITNSSGANVVLGVARASGVRCLATLADGSYQFGYYYLRSDSEVRVYKSGSACTGTYLYWGFQALSARNQQSGLIALSLNTAP